MENEVDLGFVMTPEGEIKLVKCIQFNEVDNRIVSVFLTEKDTIFMHIKNNEVDVEQRMHLSKDSYALLFLGAVHANKHFGINIEETIAKMIPSGQLAFSSYPAIKDLENFQDGIQK